jgi:hypothetical protein
MARPLHWAWLKQRVVTMEPVTHDREGRAPRRTARADQHHLHALERRSHARACRQGGLRREAERVLAIADRLRND